tara:strand:+ start:3136 stop:3357 length:222 start_codon:yes stop_codon:yes gene_type:complete
MKRQPKIKQWSSKQADTTNSTVHLATTPPKEKKKNILIERLMGMRRQIWGESSKSGKHATQKQANGAFGKKPA